MSKLSVFVSHLNKQSLILKHASFSPWKSIIIFLFIISLAIAPSEGLQLSAFSSADIPTNSILNQRQFGIPIFSPTIILLLPLLLIFIRESLRTKIKTKLLNFELLFFLLLIIAQLSAIFSFNASASAIWLLKFLFGITIYVIFSRLELNKNLLQTILFAFLTVILLNVTIAGLQFIRGGIIGVIFEDIRSISSPLRMLSFQESGYFRVTGLLSDPKGLSSYLGLILPLAFALSFLKNKKLKIILYIATVGCLGTSLISLSRLGLVKNLFSLILVFTIIRLLRLYSKLFRDIKIYIILAIVTVIMVFTNDAISARFLRFSPQDSSLKVRLELISQSLETIKQNPLLGIGPGTFPVYFINYDYTQLKTSSRFPAPVHNFYLLLASEIGIPALLTLFFILISIIKFFLERIRFVKKERKFIAIGLFTSIITFFFGGLLDLYSFENRVGFLFFLTLGLFVNILSEKNLPITHSPKTAH